MIVPNSAKASKMRAAVNTVGNPAIVAMTPETDTARMLLRLSKKAMVENATPRRSSGIISITYALFEGPRNAVLSPRKIETTKSWGRFLVTNNVPNATIEQAREIRIIVFRPILSERNPDGKLARLLTNCRIVVITPKMMRDRPISPVR
jgi:hypothetical protein